MLPSRGARKVGNSNILLEVSDLTRSLFHSLSLNARPLLALHHTIVSDPDPFPVKKSQKLAAGDGLLSSGGVCRTQMLLSVEPLRLEQLPLTLPPPSVKPSGPRRSSES